MTETVPERDNGLPTPEWLWVWRPSGLQWDDIVSASHGYRPRDGREVVKYVPATALEAAQARVGELEAERDEARRRRDEWRKKAEGYDEVRLALREKVGAPWPPNLSRALWAGIAADEKKRADDAELALATARREALEGRE